MKFSKGCIRTRIIFGSFFLFVMLLLSQNALGASTIQGIVYDKQRNPLSQIDVELLNDYHQMVQRSQTDGSGRYQFNGLRDGRYSVRVYAFRYDLQDQTQDIEIYTQNVRGGEGTGFFLTDFYLLPKKGGLAYAEIGVVFAQEVSPQAKKLYDSAIGNLSKKRTEEGIVNLYEAIKVFPEYYAALHRIGRELFIMGNYKDAYPYFFKAAEVNPKSATSYYYLGFSLHNLGKEYNKAATTALKQAYVLAPSSTQVLYVLGKVERSEGDYENAEKHLVQAKKLSKVSIPEIHKELAQLYANDLKKYNEAADELELYLKSSKLSGDEEKKTKKIISDFREKAKSKMNKS